MTASFGWAAHNPVDTLQLNVYFGAIYAMHPAVYSSTEFIWSGSV